MSQETLRSCPTCGGEFNPEALGLRDYSWLNEVVPGASDLDFALEQKSTGRLLIVEFKSQGQRLPMGQRLLLKTLARKGCDIWVAWQKRNGSIDVADLDGRGELVGFRNLTREGLAAAVDAWWATGSASSSASGSA